MEFKIFYDMPDAALEVRITVFVEEQGFRDEFDDTDKTAMHIVAFDGDRPIGTCRVFTKEDVGTYYLGRLAVVKDFRGQGIGSKIMKCAESAVAVNGGKKIVLHSQLRAVDFYEKIGYTQFGEIEEEEGYPHIWMSKKI